MTELRRSMLKQNVKSRQRMVADDATAAAEPEDELAGDEKEDLRHG